MSRYGVVHAFGHNEGFLSSSRVKAGKKKKKKSLNGACPTASLPALSGCRNTTAAVPTLTGKEFWSLEFRELLHTREKTYETVAYFIPLDTGSGS